MEKIKIIIETELSPEMDAETTFNQFVDWLQKRFEYQGYPKCLGESTNFYYE